MLESFNKVARETPALMSSFEFCEIFKKQGCRQWGEGSIWSKNVFLRKIGKHKIFTCG